MGVYPLVSELGAEASLSKIDAFLTGSYFTFQALVWTSSINLIKPSADAIITAIIFLTVGLNPRPVSLSSIFLSKASVIKASYSDNFLLAVVSKDDIVASNLPSPSKTNHFSFDKA